MESNGMGSNQLEGVVTVTLVNYRPSKRQLLQGVNTFLFVLKGFTQDFLLGKELPAQQSSTSLGFVFSKTGTRSISRLGLELGYMAPGCKAAAQCSC